MTDRTLRSISDLSVIDFAKTDGLVPVVAQHAESGAVLMVAWGNRQALELTLETGRLHFWSRSRARLWMKGETSGNTLMVTSLHTDCDADSILALVKPTGPACHTGDATCFGTTSATEKGEPAGRSDPLEQLDRTLASRAEERPGGSYTVRLLDDANLRLKKLGEETAELVAALATADGERATEEAADLLYHVLVALRAEGVGLRGVLRVLRARHG